MSQKWEDLVMAHYSEEASAIQSSLPDDLIADTFEGRAWFSVVAFRLTNLCIRPFTFLRWPDFWEINLRTYVRDKEGNRGVWFYSLDSSDLFGVIGARLLYGLRYNFARIGRTGSASGKKMIYHGQRGKIASSTIEAEWKDKKFVSSASGSLDHFLLERYRFWARRGPAKNSSSAFVRHIPYEAIRLNKIHYGGGCLPARDLQNLRKIPSLGTIARALV